MIRLAAVFAMFVALVFAAPTAAPAAPFTSAFDALTAELETRRDNDFSGTLDAAQKKQKSAVLKSLSTIAKPASTLAQDLAHGVTVIGLIEKPYAAEFTSRTGVGAAGLATIQNLLNLLSDYGYENAGKYASVLSTKLAAAATAVNTDLFNVPRATYPSQTARLKAYLKLHKKHVALAKSVTQEFAKGDLVLWSVNDTYRRGTTAQCEWYEGDNTLQIFGSVTSTSGVLNEAYFLVGGIDGPGTYPLTGAFVEGTIRSGIPPNLTTFTLNPGSGSLVIETVDPAKKRFKGRLSCTLTGGAGPSVIQLNELRFDVRKDVSIRTGNGF